MDKKNLILLITPTSQLENLASLEKRLSTYHCLVLLYVVPSTSLCHYQATSTNGLVHELVKEAKHVMDEICKHLDVPDLPCIVAEGIPQREAKRLALHMGGADIAELAPHHERAGKALVH